MSKKFYAQKDDLGFPILGTMMRGLYIPNQKNIIEIKPGLALGTHPQKYKFYVRKDVKGNIIPNSLFVSYDVQNPNKNIDLHTSSVGPNSIQFVVDTTGGTSFIFSFTTVLPINFTINWGDGTTHVDSGNGGYYEESHSYPQENREYTATITFDDASLVTELDFWGND